MALSGAGASIAIDDCYELWESGFISIPHNFQACMRAEVSMGRMCQLICSGRAWGAARSAASLCLMACVTKWPAQHLSRSLLYVQLGRLGVRSTGSGRQPQLFRGERW